MTAVLVAPSSYNPESLSPEEQEAAANGNTQSVDRAVELVNGVMSELLCCKVPVFQEDVDTAVRSAFILYFTASFVL